MTRLRTHVRQRVFRIGSAVAKSSWLTSLFPGEYPEYTVPPFRR